MYSRPLATLPALLLAVYCCTAARETTPTLSLPTGLLSPLPMLDTNAEENSNADLNFMQIGAKYGLKVKEYVVYTEDGYRLKVFRLKGEGCGLPILLFHGLLDSCDTWIIRGNGSLAVTLGRMGCDVWLGNVRGNKHSQGHISDGLALNSTFWNFSFHDHGVHDLATTIDLVLKQTGASKLNSIGHSQGTTINFVLLSTKPEYNDKVNLFIALAPVAYLHHSPSALAAVLRTYPAIHTTLNLIKKYSLFAQGSLEQSLIRNLCSTPIISYSVCLFIVSALSGFDLAEVDPAFSVVIFKHFVAGTSIKNFVHYGQVITSNRFAQLDYGREGNLAAYNSTTPPHYKLANVKSKVVLLTALNDLFCALADVNLLRKKLPNVVRFEIIPRPLMNHINFVWGANMENYLFPYIFTSLEKYGSL